MVGKRQKLSTLLNCFNPVLILAWIKVFQTNAIVFCFQETLDPEKVLSGGGQLPLGGMELTSELTVKVFFTLLFFLSFKAGLKI